MKNSKLFNKIDSYTKLSFYADRKQFLNKISSNLNSFNINKADLPDYIFNDIKSVYNLFRFSSNGGIPNLEAYPEIKSLPELNSLPSINLNDLKSNYEKALVKAKLEESFPKTVFLKLEQAISNIDYYLNNSEAQTKNFQQLTNAPQLPSINTDVQKKLSEICVKNNFISAPLTIDGKLGPLTRAALNHFKNLNNSYGGDPNLSDSGAFDLLNAIKWGDDMTNALKSLNNKKRSSQIPLI